MGWRGRLAGSLVGSSGTCQAAKRGVRRKGVVAMRALRLLGAGGCHGAARGYAGCV